MKREMCLAVLSFELNNFCIIQHHYIIKKKHDKINLMALIKHIKEYRQIVFTFENKVTITMIYITVEYF
jgi:hypothetical protein